MLEKLKKIAKLIKNQVDLYRAILRDSRTPLISKIFLSIAVGYLLLPFDIIPDFIPVLGQLDDIVIVSGFIFMALKFIPQEVIAEHRARLYISK